MCGSQSCKAVDLNEGLLFHRDKPGGLKALGVSSDSPVNDPSSFSLHFFLFSTSTGRKDLAFHFLFLLMILTRQLH